MNRQVLLVRRPHGVPRAEDFAIAATPAPSPQPGQILIRNIYLSVDPAQRGWASAETNYSSPVALGGPMRALAVGVIVETRHPHFSAGEFVYGWFGWQDYAAVEPALREGWQSSRAGWVEALFAGRSHAEVIVPPVSVTCFISRRRQHDASAPRI